MFLIDGKSLFHSLYLFMFFHVKQNNITFSIWIYIISGVARIMEKHRHKLFWRGVWCCSRVSMGKSSRKLTGYTTESMTFLIILEVLLTTWNSDYFDSFWQYHYGLTRTLSPWLPRQTSPGPDGWSPYCIPYETLMPKGITRYMSDLLFVMKYSLFFTCISLWNVPKNHIQVDLRMPVYMHKW